MFVEEGEHVEGPVVGVELGLEVGDVPDCVVVAPDPLQHVLDEVVLQVDLLLELRDHLVTVGPQVLLGHVVLLEGGQEIAQFFELELVQIALQHQFEHFSPVNLEVQLIEHHQ